MADHASAALMKASVPTSTDVIEQANAIAATLVGRQAETEERTFYAPDTHEEFRRAGLYRLLVPRRFHGYELGIDTFLRVTTTLARACPSTGWMYCLGAAHALAVATFFGARAQAELFAGGDFICPAAIAHSGTARRSGDSWVINGTWKYCSGAPYATHFLGHTLVDRGAGSAPESMLFIVPREQWHHLDDWGQQLGLRGSGSHSIVVVDAEIPDHFTIRPAHLANFTVTAGTPGRTLHQNPLYGGGALGFMFLELGALSVGMAQGALDAYSELLRTRTTFFPPVVPRSQNADYQVWFGEASGLVDAAEAAFFGAARRWADLCGGDPADFTREQDLRIAMICREVIRMCWRAVERHLLPTAGSSAVMPGDRLERVWRDMSMLQTHAGTGVFLGTLANRALAQALFTDAATDFATS